MESEEIERGKWKKKEENGKRKEEKEGGREERGEQILEMGIGNGINRFNCKDGIKMAKVRKTTSKCWIKRCYATTT